MSKIVHVFINCIQTLVDFCLSLDLMRHAETLLYCLPFIVYIVMIYGIGSIALAIPISPAGFALWDNILSSILLCTTILAYHEHPARIEKVLQLGIIANQVNFNDEILWEM